MEKDNTLERADGNTARYWLIPAERRPKMFTPHPTVSSDEVRERTQAVWERFYRLETIWKGSNCVKSLKARLAFLFMSKLIGRCTRKPASPR
jgi:hypothetical protein